MFQAEGIVRLKVLRQGRVYGTFEKLKECCEFKQQTYETERSVETRAKPGWPWALKRFP